MTSTDNPPGDSEFELTLFGPGYGESIVMHMGGGYWAVVDSCVNNEETPVALQYLDSLGLDPQRAVVLIVASHWHDDHIRGIARLVEWAPNAKFCCASALCSQEFLSLVGALEGRRLSASGSGLREIHRIFSLLEAEKRRPIHALASRIVYQQETCTVWSLSPSDRLFQRFLVSIGNLIPNRSENTARVRTTTPNEVAIALWIEAVDFALLLGSDLEKRGWIAVLEDSVRPPGKASAFKVPHHGSADADESLVWERMLIDEPFAVLAPWRRGGRVLPTTEDARRILDSTPNAWITSKGMSRRPRQKLKNWTEEKTVRESSAQIQGSAGEMGMLRLRRSIDLKTRWTVETFHSACHLSDCAA